MFIFYIITTSFIYTFFPYTTLFRSQLIIVGEKCPDKIIHFVKDKIITHTTGTIDYVEMYRYPELQPVTSQIETQIIIAIAVQFSHARLIDNIIVDQTGMLIERI